MAVHETVIEPKRGWAPVNLGELWRFRELLYFLAWRDVKVKYKQAALGVTWAVLQPVLLTTIFSLLFGRLARIPSDGTPYPIFVLLGLLPWNYFSSVLGSSSSSLVSESNLITKIYFPRLIIPASTAVAALFDLLVAFSILAALMVWYGVAPGLPMLIIPGLVAITMMNAIGFGMWFSALNVRYRDIQYVIPFLIQIWMFATPVIYPKSLLGGKLGWILMLNPMGGVIEALRASVLGHVPVPWAALVISTVVGLAVFVSGVFYFRRVERYFADII